MFDQIPLEILEQYEGQWIVWDQDARKIIGSGATLDAAEDQAGQVTTDHLLRIHHVLPGDSDIAETL